MPTPARSPETLQRALDLVAEHGTVMEASKHCDIPRSTLQSQYAAAKLNPPSLLADYNLDQSSRTAKEAWDSHAATFERVASDTIKKQWRTIHRPKGPFVIFHSTDEHVDDDKTPLRLIERDVKAAQDLDAIMCHGGDLLNNWPLAGRLAKQWAEQQCTLPDALLRAEYFLEMFKPDVATHGNHEEMNPYLATMLEGWFPQDCITDYWSVNFRVETPGGRPLRAVMSHKFQKGSSWFHKAHGHIREMLEGEEADLLMDGHVHSDGVLDHTLPERQHAALCVASAGYKVLDKYAARISRGGKMPKIRGRSHYIVCDPMAEFDENFCTAFKSARQAEAMLNGLQNLRAA